MSSDAYSPFGKRWHDAAGVHIDVRGLPAPQPLVAILHLVRAQGAVGAAVSVRYDRGPLLLYAELAEIGWSAYRKSLIHECVTGQRRLAGADFRAENIEQALAPDDAPPKSSLYRSNG